MDIIEPLLEGDVPLLIYLNGIVTLNTAFRPLTFRVDYVGQSLRHETLASLIVTNPKIQDVQYQVEAAVVRIMKAHKIMSSATILSELCGQLKFAITVSFISIVN